MPFHSYLSPSDVARRHRLHWRKAEVLGAVPFVLSEYFREELALTLTDVPFDRSESAACETLIYPLLREVWKPYRADLTIWSHEPIAFDEDLCGVPDFLISRRSPLGIFVPDQPFLLVVEAKRDDFARGWGQCLAAMRAAQKISGLDDLIFQGIATNGRTWEFGKLEGEDFTQDTRPFTIQGLSELAEALHDVILRCRDQAARLPAGV